MQLKFKKVTLLTTIIVYCASFLIQSNLAFFQTWAAEVNTPRVNLVAILVDNRIYDSISGPLQWYASSYVQQQLSDTKALVMPLNLSSVSAYDIHRMMENIYFDGLKDVNSSLIGMIMVGDIPLPVVNQDGYVFPTVYPYVDFEDQKYVRDPDSQYFVSNNNPGGQAEIWHGLINYGTDAKSYIDFFEKIKKYVEKPDEFIGDAFWYEDFIASKEGFLNENYPYYRNKIMFGEDLSYQRYSTLMKKMFYGESTDNSVDIVGEFGGAVDSAGGDAEDIWNSIDPDLINQLKDQGTEGLHTTKMIQQEIEDSFLADYDDLFSNTSLSTMRENVLAGGRWLKTNNNADGQATLLANVDSSASMIQLKDTMYLGNQNLQGLFENLNELMENMIDKKIEDEKYSMDIVVPMEYKKIEGKRVYFSCYPFVTRFENYYFGKNVRLINNAQELSIYRGTYRNLTDLTGVTFDSLKKGDNPSISALDKTDIKLKSIGGSYDIFSNQAEGNRGYYMLSAANDYNTFEDNKTRKEDKEKHERVKGLFKIRRKVWPEGCTGSKKEEKKCETLHEFALRRWGGASSINLNDEKVGEGRYELSGYDARNSWKSIYDMGGFQSLLSGKDEGMKGKGRVDGMGTGPQTAATSYKSYIKYASPTEVEGWSKKSILGIKFYSIYANHSPNTHMDFNLINYWNLSTANILMNPKWKFSKEGERILNIEKKDLASDPRCTMTEKYSYKILSSVVKHDSTNSGEINGIDYDKYGDEGELGKNYYDIRVAYEDLDADLNRITESLSGLVQNVKTNNDEMKSWIDKLDGLSSDLKKNNDRRDQLDSEIFRLEGEIKTLNEQLTSINSEIDKVKDDLDYYVAHNGDSTGEVDEEGNEVTVSYDDKIAELQEKLEDLRTEAGRLSGSISSKETEKNTAKTERGNVQTSIDGFNGNVGDILPTVSGIVSGENSQLSNIYSEIVGLFADNIIGTMEYIIYLQGGDPADYTGTSVPENAPKVPFLPEWILKINTMSKVIQLNVNGLKSHYKEVYDLIVEQQGLWKTLKEQLRKESVRGSGEGMVSEKIDTVDGQMINIFTIKSGDTDESHMDDMSECENNDCNTEHLKQNTADERVKDFVESLKYADLMFKNITKVDTGGSAIIEAALVDIDFQKWSAKKGIDLGSLSGAALINQYARWAQTDGESTTGARVNQELLAGASIHMSGMNVLTSDRPIDSPRYVSMQSIAGNEIKLIYPDLFKVEVYVLTGQDKSGYDIHELLTGGQIKEKLVKYLTGKVEEYNKILETEYKKSETSFDGKTLYYNRLKSEGFALATPDKSVRPYQYFTYEDFENALGGSGMLDVISEMLYYQSLTNKKKLSTGGVADDIELIKKSFSLNDRREWVLKDFLTEWTGEELKTTKNPLLVIPTYELYGYEVAYVNSDGKDYIIPTEEDINVSNNTKVDAKIRRHQPIQQEGDLGDKCNIPKNGKLPIFALKGGRVTSPWFDGVKCRWQYTLEEPAKIELKFDKALGEVLVGSGFEEFMKSIKKSIFSETEEEFTQWGDQMTKYADAWESLFSKGTGYDADKAITQMQVEAQKHNAELNVGGSNVSNISRNVKISNSNALLSDSNPSSLLRIESITNVGNINVVFMGTGDGCIKFDGATLCDGATTARTFNPKTNPFSGLVETTHKAGKAALDIKIYGGGGYFEEVLKYIVSPSELDNFEIKVGDKQTVAGMISPVEVIGYDKYHNRADWGLEKFDFTVSQGEFLVDGAYKPEFSTNDFRDLRLYYKAPLNLEGNKALIKISRQSDPGKEVVVKPKNPYEQPVVDGAPLVKLNGTQILRGKTNLSVSRDYKLTNDQDIYDVAGNLRKGKLQRLDVEIENLEGGGVVDVDSQILVTSKNGLVYVGQIQKDENGNEFFFETSKNYISGGKATIYYYPSTVAGEEVINIDIPGLETRVINLSIKPADLANAQLVLEKDVLDLGDIMNIELFLSDRWGNLIDDDNLYTLYYDQDKVEFVDPNDGKDGEILVPYKQGYGKYTIYGTGAGLAYIRVGNEFYYFNVDKHIFPDSGLNILYLNYFGNDRGNQWGYMSDNNHHIESVMSKSNKIITTTTQLVSEDKIKKMVWKIEPGFKVWDPDNIGTRMSINGNQVHMIVGGISAMKTALPSFKWMEVTPISLDVILKEKGDGNYAFFIPRDSKYSVDKNGVLYNSGERIVGLGNGDVSFQLSTSFSDNGDNVWTVIYKGVNYGSLIIHYPGFSPNVGSFDTPGDRYLIDNTFTHGSTDKLTSVGIFDLLTNFELNTNYKSIQNSDELEEKIGFLGDFKNITLFAEGEIVGEATRKFGSEFVINLGDPVLSRKGMNEEVYGTEYDGGIGQEIYADPESNIFGTYQIDFNRDGNKDLLVVYLNGSIKIAKNYGGTPDLRNMQELMRIAVPIQNVFVGDADGKGGEDILVLTKNNQLRAYLNNGGVFDVDGRVACLNQNVFGGEVSSTPSSLEGIYQIFLEYMEGENDKNIDVITYDNKGYIKVFYGGSTRNGPNYLSTESYACDTGWYDREAGNMTIVDALGVAIDGNDVFDNSMLHRVGMTKPDIEIKENELEEYGIHIDKDNLDKKISERTEKGDGSIKDAVLEIMDINDPMKPNFKFDQSEASDKFIEKDAKYVNVTLYENDLVGGGDGNNYVFAPSSYLDPECGEDIGSVRKNYRITKGGPVLQDGDIVTVTVTVKASDAASFHGAFGDIIQGPWNLYYDENKILKSIRFTLNQGNAVIKQRDGNFAYIVDNISLSPGQMMKFEYDLEYRSVPLRKMDITYETFYSSDTFPDIKLQSVDGCVKDFDVYENGGRSFGKKTILLQDIINDTYKEEDQKTEDYTQKVINVGSDVNQLPGIVGDKIDRVSLLGSLILGDELVISEGEDGKTKLKDAMLQKIEEGGLASLNMNLNVDLSIFEEQANAIEDVIDDITKGMCNGFQFGGTSNCPGLPVPFNQAFLAPGKYHLFGCWDLPLGPLEKGLPVFFFPGTLPTPLGPVPIPRGQKGPGDEFIWVPNGVYPSFIRIYAAPTLTAQLGIGICLGSYAVGKAIPSPFADLGGNCIVFAVKPQCKNDGSIPTNKESPYESYSDFVEEVRDSGICLQSQKGPQVTEKGNISSPTRGVSYGSTSRSRTRTITPTHDDIILNDNQINDILGDMQKLVGSDVNVREVWNEALKGRVGPISLSLLDLLFGGDNVDKLYDKYFKDAKLTVADNYVDYSVNVDLGIINLEREAYVASEEEPEVKNSIIIGDVDILGGNFTKNRIKGGIQQGLRKILIYKWLDPQIRYIVNQLTKMHVNIIWPDLSDLMGDDLTTLYNISLLSGVTMENVSTSLADVKTYYGNFIKSEGNKISDAGDQIGGAFDDYASKVKTSQRHGISTQSINEFNSKIGNPFESLATLMNQSNIINISTEPLTVKVPMIFSEDINEYQFYLYQWIDENQAIMNDWGALLNGLVTNCSKLPENEREACRLRANENLASFIEFERGDWQNMLNKVYTNLMILQEYRNFPFEIYEWIHVIDRYMSEIASLINNTVGYLSYWVVANSERFVGYIDAITLMLNIIKTYQLIIDFSVDRSKKCGNCAKDTYDQYSCKLSFLCDSIELPIIQIPNFKLPNITLDFSSIDIGLDVILPEFNFQPVKIALPDIPNLPEPPSIGANIKLFDLPNIPILPEPPTLPELPSFIPEVEIELPILPPAPELPELPNTIEGTIKLADVIGKIYCIVKKQFGLVGEGSLKAKIEQITQRTYEVERIDKIMDFTNWSQAPVRAYGLDFEVSSNVDLHFTMSDFYAYMDALTKGINNLTEYTVDKAREGVDNVKNYVEDTNFIKQVKEDLDGVDGANLKLNIGMLDSEDANIPGLASDEINYVNYDKAKNRLNEVLAYFKGEAKNTTFADSIGGDIAKIENEISKPNVVVANTGGIDDMKNEIMNYLDKEKSYYDELADLINNDYDGFLAMVDTQSKGGVVNKDGEKLLTFNVQLFNLDSSTKETVKSISKADPYRSLIENKQEIIDGYWNAVNTNTSDSLGLSEKEYLVLRNNISSMKKQISTLYSVVVPASSTQLVAKDGAASTVKSLVVAGEEGTRRIGSNMEVAKVIDPSVFSDGIYEKMIKGAEAGKLTKVVNSDSFVEEIGGNFYDTNPFGSHDIILRDENSIYKKCVSQICSNGGNHYGGYYMAHVSEVPYRETWINLGENTKLKIADGDVEVKNWKVVGQSYDILSFSWDLSDVDAYLIKLVERVDHSYEKNDYNSKAAVSYILALPNGVELSGLYENKIKLELIKDKSHKTIQKIEDLYGSPLVEVVYYDSQKDVANIIISNLERKWYYGRISTLDLQDNTYYINSPWSNQVVAGKQAVGDDQAPLAEQQLFRPSTQEVVSEGDDLEGYVGTRYVLNIKWKDNVALSYINVSQNGIIIDEKYTSKKEDTLSAPIDMHFQHEMETFDLLGIDQFGNKTEKTVTVTYSIPTIKLTDISKNPGGETVTITAELSQDIDEGNVSFQRRRANSWKTMKKKYSDCADLSIGPKQKVILGSGYAFGNQIAMYDKDESVIALLNPDTSEITIQTGYVDLYEVNVKVINSAVLHVCNKKTKEDKFSVSIPTDNCLKIEAENYTVVDLPKDGNMGMFNGGMVVHKDGNNILLASPTCHLYSEYGLEGTYSYDRESDAVVLTLYEPSDIEKSSPIRVRLKTKTFLPN